ncbi:NHLP-related RiPP peptide [Xanthomonas sacchari]
MNGKKIELDKNITERFLSKLGSDNAFRKLFKKSPLEALESLGYELPIDCQTPPCFLVKKIAPKKEIIKAYNALRIQLTSQTSQTNPHCFEAGRVLESLERKKGISIVTHSSSVANQTLRI